MVWRPMPVTAWIACADRCRRFINAPVLMWTDDAIAFFFLQIQGSGRAQMDDGAITRLGLCGAERPVLYTAIGRTLIDQNELTREEVSLQTIRAWLIAHPGRAQAVMETDQELCFLPRGGAG